MNVGTKSLLFGYHQVLIHPIFIARAWIKLYGWPRNWRTWVAFVVHDWGYWGSPNMDGDEGEQHVLRGADIMFYLGGPNWYNFMRFHSRFYAQKCNAPFSRLCVADKLVICMYPRWLGLLLTSLSGEVNEYMERTKSGKYAAERPAPKSRQQWWDDLNSFMRDWVRNNQHKASDSVIA